MKKFFSPVTVLTTLCVIPLTVATLYYNIPPAISGAGNILLLMASYVFDRRARNILIAGSVNFIALVIVITVGYQIHTDFLLFRWVAETIAYSSVALMLFYLSKRVRDLKEVKASEERLDIALDAITAGLWDWNIADDKRWWSPRHFELLGYANNEIQPGDDTLRKLIHPDDVVMAYNVMEAHLRLEQRFEIELRYKLKNGQYKWFLASGITKFNAGGEPVRMVGSIIDIDEKKRAQETIAQQAALIQMMPDGVIYADKDRVVVSVNRGAEDFLETTAPEIIGKKLDHFITVKAIRSTNEQARKDLWKTGFWRGEVEAVNHKGRKSTVLATVKVLNNINGNEAGWVCIYTDISLLRLNEELQLALKDLKISNQYLEQLAYMSAHDIKSPIITLDGLVDILIRAKGVKEEYTEMVQMIKGTTQQMYRTNNSLNNVLKLRQTLLTGKNRVDELVPLWTIADDIKATLQTNIDSINGEFVIDLNSTGNIKLPQLHFRSIIYNLVNNAIKYYNPQTPLVVKLQARRSGKGELELVVEDNGLGMDLNLNKDKLFGIFKRFHDHVEGTGVGLHMVKSIVDAYGGKIEVESAPGLGTRFSISFKEILATNEA